MAVSKWPEVESKLNLVTAWARDGLVEIDICHNLGIGIQTMQTYKKEHPSFLEALKIGKEVTDITVVNALYKRTQGYRYDEVTTERMPIYDDVDKDVIIDYHMVETKRVTKEVLPDPTSMIFWLKNRCKEQWRDKHEVEKTIEVRVPMLEEIQDTFKHMRQLNSVDVIDIKTDV
jgi:hypothetical protein